MAEKRNTTKSAPRRATTRKSKAVRREPTHHEICERAYYIHLQDHASDEVANWLRAERELMVA